MPRGTANAACVSLYLITSRWSGSKEPTDRLAISGASDSIGATGCTVVRSNLDVTQFSSPSDLRMQTGRLPWCNIDDDAKLGVVAAYPIWVIGIGVGAT